MADVGEHCVIGAGSVVVKPIDAGDAWRSATRPRRSVPRGLSRDDHDLLVIGYVYLCIHRPFEIWPALGDLRIELIYFTCLCGAWLVAGKRMRSRSSLLAIVGMGAAFYFSWA